eukprot:s1356_g4.t1
MASKRSVAAVGLAGVVAGSAFIAGTSSQPRRALRASTQAQAKEARPASSSAPLTAASLVAVSAGAVYAETLPKLVGFWDPLGLARDGDVEAFQRRRSVELKHGRIAMLATMGYITPEIAGKWPGYLDPAGGLKFADIPNGLAAISKVPAGGWTQILLWMAWCEVSRGAGSDIARGRPGTSSQSPKEGGGGWGDFGWYVLTAADPEEKQKKLNAELANGRLAMMAIIGMFYQDGLTGSAWGDWLRGRGIQSHTV